MRYIGIDIQFSDVYQDEGNAYRTISPAPIVFEALFDPQPESQFRDDFMYARWVFREDAFDPTTRLRRGRFYFTTGSQPNRHAVLPRTREAYEHSLRSRDMFTFSQYQSSSDIALSKIVALGAIESVWLIVAPPERISTGEFLFTLKARHGFGILPEIDRTRVPEVGRSKVIEAVESLTDAAHRGAPTSIIDLACEAIQWCLATWATSKFSKVNFFEKELERILRDIEVKYKDENGNPIPMIALKIAEVVQRLHPRRKAHEQQRRGLRPPVEGDAQFALNATAFVIRELGWEAV